MFGGYLPVEKHNRKFFFKTREATRCTKRRQCLYERMDNRYKQIPYQNRDKVKGASMPPKQPCPLP
jgi:hypothetical protein